MEKIITVQKQYNSLDTLYDFLKTTSSFECYKNYDNWEVRTDANGQMAQCIVLKKSAMHAVKLYFAEENTIKINHIIPSSIMNAYFGKSVKARRSIIEIIAGKIKETVLAPSQEKAFQELEGVINKAAM
ncbi:hypothetical protein IWQ47_001565 [Aquimarina sp. EL_43]|uniref:hypothetical protein n=1 Tax=unclassified Aquimarina TaxID=2627091 RepID=UPI0018CABC5F|nr:MULTISPECIES: hypothetical protein [unclassified Aquimarina]MBG6130352.1 hypothetical protein [Aquimarina sp. EL_35]MBG6149132.1 hypothetical protein [Aquimarina sp. EL_32]MBG6168494.1 hypothetical protein [Aquimarina sp. EL_43]